MTDGVSDLRTEQFRIRNDRVLRDVALKDITPLTVLCGPNCSGKSTVIDVFALLYAAFTTNFRRAPDERNRLAEMRSREEEGPVGIEIKYRTNLDGASRLGTYSLELGEARGIPVVQTEQLRWTPAPGYAAPGRWRRLEILVGDRQAEQALRHLVPRIVPGHTFQIRSFGGKHAPLKRLPSRLRGCAVQIRRDPELRVVVVVDLDHEGYRLKKLLEEASTSSARPTLRSLRATELPVVATRIAVGELEAWFIGNVDAARVAYPRVPQSLAARQEFRVPGDVRGGTREALERLRQSRGYHSSGLRKIAPASDVARHMDVEKNRSASFCCLRDGLHRLASGRVSV